MTVFMFNRKFLHKLKITGGSDLFFLKNLLFCNGSFIHSPLGKGRGGSLKIIPGMNEFE